MKEIRRTITAGVAAMLASATQGMMLLCDGEGGNVVAWVAELTSSNNTSHSAFVLPNPGGGLAPLRKQYLKMGLDAATDDGGFVCFFFGKGEKPLFSLVLSGERTPLLVPEGEYPAAEWFEMEGEHPHAPVNWRAQIWPTSKLLRVVMPEGETRLSLADTALSNPAWQNGLARLLVANASVTLYRLAGMDVPSLFMIR